VAGTCEWSLEADRHQRPIQVRGSRALSIRVLTSQRGGHAHRRDRQPAGLEVPHVARVRMWSPRWGDAAPWPGRTRAACAACGRLPAVTDHQHSTDEWGTAGLRRGWLLVHAGRKWGRSVAAVAGVGECVGGASKRLPGRWNKQGHGGRHVGNSRDGCLAGMLEASGKPTCGPRASWVTMRLMATLKPRQVPRNTAPCSGRQAVTTAAWTILHCLLARNACGTAMLSMKRFVRVRA
jgi:hypothetical protein